MIFIILFDRHKNRTILQFQKTTLKEKKRPPRANSRNNRIENKNSPIPERTSTKSLILENQFKYM
jgi:hypothetical protein